MLLLGRVSFSDQHFLQYALPSCSVRYETRHYHNYTCEQIYAAQPICKRKLRIAYSHFPPYIFQDANKNVKGFIPGILLLKMIYSLKEWRLLKFVKNSVKSLQNLIIRLDLIFTKFYPCTVRVLILRALFLVEHIRTIQIKRPWAWYSSLMTKQNHQVMKCKGYSTFSAFFFS